MLQQGQGLGQGLTQALLLWLCLPMLLLPPPVPLLLAMLVAAGGAAALAQLAAAFVQVCCYRMPSRQAGAHGMACCARPAAAPHQQHQRCD